MNDATFLSRQIAEWRASEALGPVAVVVGADDATFVAALIADRPNRFSLLCDKSFADEATRMANENLKNPPRLRVSARFRHELTEAQRLGGDRALAVPFRTVAAHILAETRRVRRRSELMFGDPDREDGAATKVVRAARRLVQNLAAFSATDLLFCDPGGDCLRAKDGLAHVIAPPDFKLDAVGDFAAARIEDRPWNAEEEARILARAAYFTEQTLEELGPSLDPNDDDGILAEMTADWRAEMETLMARSESAAARETGARALARLNDAFGAA